MSEEIFLEKLAASYQAKAARMIRRGRRRGLRDAEDAVHDAYLSVLSARKFNRRVIRYLPKRHADRTSGALGGQIRRDFHQEASLDVIAESRGALERRFEQLELRDETEALLRRLKPSYRLVLELRYLGELRLCEISQLTGLKVAAIKSLLHRARRTAREEIRCVRGILTPSATNSADEVDGYAGR